jgi:regulator of sirC expression with transglutaminase-like and TPR domain
MANEYGTIGLLEEDAIELDTSALALASPDHPGLDLQPYFEHLTQVTRRLVETARNATSSFDRAEALSCVLAGVFGYQGDVETYEHPANADLIKVIDRRRGLPVGLSILYVAAARRLGWVADVLNTPGHVLVGVGSETDRQIIDPFGKGAVVTRDRLAALLQQMLGVDARPSPEHVAPMENRAVLVRLLLNQSSRAESAGDLRRALTLYERMTAIAPDYPQPWWDRARLEAVAGNVQGARASLNALLEVTRDVHVRNHVYAALEALSPSRT